MIDTGDTVWEILPPKNRRGHVLNILDVDNEQEYALCWWGKNKEAWIPINNLIKVQISNVSK